VSGGVGHPTPHFNVACVGWRQDVVSLPLAPGVRSQLLAAGLRTVPDVHTCLGLAGAESAAGKVAALSQGARELGPACHSMLVQFAVIPLRLLAD
jgi:hypothetical protein